MSIWHVDREDVPVLPWTKIDPASPIDKDREERQIQNLRTNILTLEKPPHSIRQRRPATHQEIDIARSKKQRKDQAADLKDQTIHIIISSEAPP
jgi:hypothetical protein